MEYIAFGILGILGIVGFMFYRLYSSHNLMMALDERCKTAFSDIDSLLKHRHSLIPGLLETLKGYVGHEMGVLDKISQAQSDALNAANKEDKIHAEVLLGQSLNSVLSIAENYSQLKASSHFQHFRADLIDVENRITASRRFYNLTVAELNATIRQFPGSMVASKNGLGIRKAYELGVERMIMDEPVSIKF